VQTRVRCLGRGVVAKMKRLLILFVVFASLPACTQTLELGNIKLTLGMSKEEVLRQAAFIMDTSATGRGHLVLAQIPDDAVLTLSRLEDTTYCVKHEPSTCFAKVQFSHSRLTYASKSVYSAETPERTLSEVIGGILDAFDVAPNEIKPVNCELFHWVEHDNSGLANESVDIMCAGHTLSISTMPFDGRPTGDISEFVGRLRAPKIER
jgi:hypothetical protein